MAKTLSLGTLFIGEIDATFTSAVSELKKMLGTLNGALGGIGSAAEKQRSALTSLGSDMTEFQLAMGRATNQSKAFQKALSDGADKFQAYSGTALKDLESGLYRTERAIQAHAKSMSTMNQDGKTWAENADRLNMMLQEREGILRYNKKGIEQVAQTQKVLGDSTKSLGSDLTEYQMAMGRASNQSSKFREGLAKLTEVFGKQGAGLKFAEAMSYRTEKAIIAHGRAMNENKQDGDAWVKHVDRANLALDEYRGNLNYTKKGLADLTEAQQKALDMGGRAQGVFSKLGDTIKSMAYWGIAASAIYGTIRALKEGVQNVMEFDQSLKNLQAISSASDAEIMVMEKTIKRLAATTKYSGQEIANGMTIVAQAGFSASESIDTMKSIVLLATGTLSGMSETTDLLTTVIRAFELKASDSSRVADVMAAAVNKSKLDVDKLRIAFGYLAPIASEAGISLEESAVATMLLADNGLKASTIGTAFRQVLARLISPTDALSAKFQSMGADMTRLDPSTNTLKTVLTELARVAPDASAAFELFGLRGAPAVVVLTRAMQEGGKVFDEYMNKVYEVGQAQEMSDKQMQGLANRFKNLINVIGLLTISLGEGGLGSSFGLIIDLLTSFVKLLTTVSSSLAGSFFIAMSSAAAVTWLFGKALTGVGLAVWIDNLVTTWTVQRTLFGTMGALIGITKRWTETIVSFIAANWVIALGALVGGIFMLIKAERELADTASAAAIETTKHKDKLEDYRASLNKLNPESKEYQATLKRLATEYPKLRDEIDLVTGRFYDQKSGLQALDTQIESYHIKAIEQEIVALGALAKAYLQSESALGQWIFSRKSPQEQLEMLKKKIGTLLPELKNLGITNESTAEQIESAWEKFKPGIFDAFNARQVEAIIDATMAKLQDQADAAIAAEKQIAEERRKLSIGERQTEVAVYSDIVNQVGGERRRQTEEYAAELQKQINALENKSEQEEQSERGTALKVLKIWTDNLKKIAEARWQDEGTSEDVNETFLQMLMNLVERENAIYFNQRKKLDENYTLKLENAKKNNISLKKIQEQYALESARLEKKHAEEINAINDWMYENSLFSATRGWEALKAAVEVGRKALKDSLKGTTTDAGVITATTSSGTSTGLKPSTDAEILANQDKVVGTIAKRLEKSVEGTVKYLNNLWGNASEVQKQALEEILKTLSSKLDDIDKLTITSGQKQSMIRKAFGAAMGEYVEKVKELKDEQTPLQQSITKTAESLQRLDLSHMTDQLKKEDLEAQNDIQKYMKLLDELIAKIELAAMTGSKTPVIKFGNIQFDQPLDFGEVDPSKRIERFEEIKSTLQTTFAQYEQLRLKDAEEKKTKIIQREEKKKLDAKEESYRLQGQLSSIASKDEMDLINKAHNEFWKEYARIERTALELRENQTKEGADTSINIEQERLDAISRAYAKFKEDIKLAPQKMDDKAFKELDKQLDAQKAKLETLTSLEKYQALTHSASMEETLAIDARVAQQQYQIALENYNLRISLIKGEGKLQEEERAKAAKSLVTAYEKQREAMKAYFQEAHKYDEQYWNASMINTDQYHAYLKGALDLQIMDYKTYTEKMIESGDNVFDMMKLGWQQAAEESKKVGATIVETFKEARGQVTKGLAAMTMELLGKKGAISDWLENFSTWLSDRASAQLESVFGGLLDNIIPGLGGNKGIKDVKLKDGAVPVWIQGGMQGVSGKSGTLTEDQSKYASDYFGWGMTGDQSKYAKDYFGWSEDMSGDQSKYASDYFGWGNDKSLSTSIFSGFKEKFTSLFNSIGGVFGSIANGLMSLVSTVGSVISSLSGGGGGFSLGGGIGGLFSSLFSGGGGSGGFLNEGMISNLVTAGIAHTGAVLGKDVIPTRTVSVGAFTNAVRAHKGIGPGERAIVAKDDEGVFTSGQMKALGAKINTQKTIEVNMTNITDPRLIDAYLATPKGKNSMLNIISNNQTKFRRAMGIN
jgi:TP901 family phage tail tape measure protein